MGLPYQLVNAGFFTSINSINLSASFNSILPFKKAELHVAYAQNPSHPKWYQWNRPHSNRSGNGPPKQMCWFTPSGNERTIPLKRGPFSKGNESSSNFQPSIFRGYVFVFGGVQKYHVIKVTRVQHSAIS